MNRFNRWFHIAAIAVAILTAALAARAAGAPAVPQLSKEGIDFFETRIRPVLVDRCYKCHDGGGANAVKGGFSLNTRKGLLAGGESGKPAVVPGDPAASRLIQAIKWTDEKFRMPPKEEHRLSAEQVADFEAWLKMGGPDPREGAAEPTKAATVDAKRHWAFQSPKEPAVPDVKDKAWAKTPVDQFILARLEATGLAPSKQADKRTLIRRATLDLTGLPPTPEEVAAFETDSSADAFAKVVDRLLASPAYGERWGRYWLDVARYADTKGYVFEEERRFPFSYAYRDWVIRALNEDLPYDQFLIQQIAADRLQVGEDKRPLAAMGFLTIGRRFLQNQPDIIDDRIDVVTRGTMALTVQCARCHDHKFDPIPTADYYSLYGVFASSTEPSPADLPEIEKPSAAQSAKSAEFEKELAKRKDAVQAFLKSKHEELVPKLRTAEGIKTYLAAAYEFERQNEKERMDERRFGFTRELSGFVLARWRGFLTERKGAGHDPIFAPWFAYAAIERTERTEPGRPR